MQAASLEGYKPSAEFLEDSKDPLVELDLTDSKELWLIQWPNNQDPGFSGQAVTLELDHDGKLGSFESSSGKVYDLVSFSSLEPDATVFISSLTGAKNVGKISRRVSLVHYPEPSELENNKKSSYTRSSTSSKMTSSHLFSTPRSMMRGYRSLGSKSAATSTLSGRQRSALSEETGEPSMPPKRQATGEGSVLDSGRVQSGVTSSGSPKKKTKTKTKTKS